MANSFLQDNTYNLPKKVLNHLQNVLNNYNGNKKVLGYVRTKNLVNRGYLTYNNMKFILNVLRKLKNPANASGKQRYNNALYQLNGGEVLHNWIENTLDVARKQVENRKDMKQNAGVENSHRKTHSKDHSNPNSKILMPQIAKAKTKNITSGNYAYESKMTIKLNISESIFKILKKFNDER